MTESRFSRGGVLLGGVVGIVIGVVIGLLVGFVLVPPRVVNVDLADLKANAQDDYIVLVSDAYAYDRDLGEARQRLGQLNDPDLKSRIARLARAYDGKDEVIASRLAGLALALGSADQSLRVLARSSSISAAGTPTKFAQVGATAVLAAPTETTLPPFATQAPPGASPSSTLTNTESPSAVATKPNTPPSAGSATPPPTATTKPKATQVSATNVPPTAVPPTAIIQVAPPPAVDFRPSFPVSWWDDVKFIPAPVTSGQQYWHLKSGLYCDWNDERNNCPDLPGGTSDHSIYIATLDASGKCANATARDTLNTGDIVRLTPDLLKNVPYLWNPCNVDYEREMYGEGNTISIEGAPSDAITNLCLCNKTPWHGQNVLQGHAHVRYFLVFQMVTR